MAPAPERTSNWRYVTTSFDTLQAPNSYLYIVYIGCIYLWIAQ
jgi:hypothetical protein